MIRPQKYLPHHEQICSVKIAHGELFFVGIKSLIIELGSYFKLTREQKKLGRCKKYY